MKIEVKLTVYSFQIIEMREWLKKEIFFLILLQEKVMFSNISDVIRYESVKMVSIHS